MYRNRNSRLTMISWLFASGPDILVVFDKVTSKEEIVRPCTRTNSRLTLMSWPFASDPILWRYSTKSFLEKRWSGQVWMPELQTYFDVMTVCPRILRLVDECISREVIVRSNTKLITRLTLMSWLICLRIRYFEGIRQVISGEAMVRQIWISKL